MIVRFKFYSTKSLISAKKDLMCRVFEPRQRPESLTANAPGKIIFDIVPHLVISHRAFDYIVRVRLTVTTGGYKIKPFISHFRKGLDS